MAKGERGDMSWLKEISDEELIKNCVELIPLCWRSTERHDISEELFLELIRRYLELLKPKDDTA